MRYVLVVVQISEEWPHDVRVARRIIESQASREELYEATDREVRECLREGFSLCNWHLFDFNPEAAWQKQDVEFTLASGKSVSGLLRQFSATV